MLAFSYQQLFAQQKNPAILVGFFVLITISSLIKQFKM